MNATTQTLKLGELDNPTVFRIVRARWIHRGSQIVRTIPGESRAIQTRTKRGAAGDLSAWIKRWANIEMVWDEDYRCWRNVKPVGTLLVVMVYTEAGRD